MFKHKLRIKGRPNQNCQQIIQNRFGKKGQIHLNRKYLVLRSSLFCKEQKKQLG
jgi:hypothetical protein